MHGHTRRARAEECSRTYRVQYPGVGKKMACACALRYCTVGLCQYNLFRKEKKRDNDAARFRIDQGPERVGCRGAQVTGVSCCVSSQRANKCHFARGI